MAISFNAIPGNIRVPLFYAELQSGGTPFQTARRLLIFGHKLSTGTAQDNVPILVNAGVNAEDVFFGAGSQLSEMIKIARRNAPFQEIWACPIPEPTGVKNVGTADFNSVVIPTTSTILTMYVAGREYNVTVSSTSTAASIVTDMVAEILDDSYASVVPSASTTAGVIDLTARHAGTHGQDIDLRSDLYDDESTISRQVVFSQTATPGTGDPDLTDALVNIGSEPFTWIACPFNDAATLIQLGDFMDDVSGRWSPFQQMYGHVISAYSGTVGQQSAKGLTLNDQHLTVMGSFASPSPSWHIAAGLAARAAQHLSTAPELSRPMQFLSLEGIHPPRIQDRLTITDQNTLLFDGIATYTVSAVGQVQIQRSITTYRILNTGANDATFLDIQTMAQSQFFLTYMKDKVLQRHGRVGLADDDAPAITGISRPRDIRATLVTGYQELVDLGVTESVELFEEALIVERNTLDPNRIDVSVSADFVNQLRVFAMSATAYLQLNAS